MEDVLEIKAMRKFKKLTQAQFAQRLGYSRSVVNDVENMRRKPSENLQIAFSRNFEKTDEYFSFLDTYRKIVYK